MRRFAAAPSAVWSDLYYDLALVAAIVVLSGSWACWTTDTPYDPAQHRAEQRLFAA